MDRASTMVASIFFLTTVVTAVAVIGAFLGLHQVDEGFVAVYWRGGRLTQSYSRPGYNVKIPFLDHHELIQTTVQTDSVQDIPCGTSGGVMVTFGKVEVVNLLREDHVISTVRQYGPHYDKIWIFDKLHHEINQFCSRHTLAEVYIELFDTLDESLARALQADCDKYDTGVTIIAVRVTKPRIPKNIAQQFEEIEAQRNALTLAERANAVALRKARTELEVRKVALERELMEREQQKVVKAIDNEIQLAQEKSRADARAYAILSEANANEARLTPAFLTYTLLNALGNSTKWYFGNSIPQGFTPFFKSGDLGDLLIPQAHAPVSPSEGSQEVGST